MNGAFPLPLVVDASGPRQVLTEPFVFVSKSRGRVEVEKGFDTDFASVPRFLWWLYPPWGDYKRPAVVHDWDYWYQTVPRDVADKTFMEGMEAIGIPWHRRQILYRNVRAFGWLAWRDNRKKRLSGIPLT